MLVVLLGMGMEILLNGSDVHEIIEVYSPPPLRISSKHFLMCSFNSVLLTGVAFLHNYWVFSLSQLLHRHEQCFILWYSHFLWLHVFGCF